MAPVLAVGDTTMTRWRLLGPFAKGATGMALVLVLWMVSIWIYARYQEFVIMRADIAVIHPQIEQMRRQAPQPSAAPAPSSSAK